MILSRDEYMNVINTRITGTDDESLRDIENLTETFDASKGYTQDDINRAVEAKENEWRERYRARFFEGVNDQPSLETAEPEPEETTFDDIFIESEEK